MRPKLNFTVTTMYTMNGTHLTNSARVCKLMSTTVFVNPSLWFMAVREGCLEGDKQEREWVYQTNSKTCWWEYSSLGVFCLLCTELTRLWLRRSITPFFRDMLYPLVCIFVEKDSYCGRIMTPNTPQSFARTTWRPRSPNCHGLSSTVTWPQPHWTFMGPLEEWESQGFCDISRSFLEHCQILLG